MSQDTPKNSADRKIPPLQKGAGGNGMLGLAAILVVGSGALYWAFTSDKKPEEIIVQKPEYREVQSNAYELPKITERPVVNVPIDIKPVKKTVNLSARPDPRILERTINDNKAAALAATQKQQRLERERIERQARRAAPLIIFDRSQSRTAEIKNTARLSQASYNTKMLANLEARMEERERTSSKKGRVRDALAQQETDKGNEQYKSSEERFLRDVGRTEVAMVQAVALPDQDYLITQGTMIAGVLETAIHSDLSGMLRAQTVRNVYSHTGTTILIPRGSTLIGRYQNGLRNGQSRVFVVWTRVERPDGIVIDIASPGTDTLGRSGMGGRVNSHFWQRFGTSFMFSIIGAGVIVAADKEGNSSAEREVIRDTGNSFSKSAEIALENSINIAPTIHVNQGARLNVFVAKDLNFKTALGK